MIYDNRSLFSDHYLAERLGEHDEWSEDVTEAFERARAIYEAKRDILDGLNEAQTEQELVQPILEDVLGFEYEVQKAVKLQGRLNRPDYVLFPDADAKGEAQRADEESAYYERAVAVADAKYWGRPLDVQVNNGREELTNVNPSFQIVNYLVATGVPWGVLTNGRLWRLYYAGARSRIDTYFEVDLARILDDGDEDDFRWFLLFFRAAAFAPDPDTGRGLLEAVHARSVEYGVAALLGAAGNAHDFEVDDHPDRPARIQAVVDFYGPVDLLAIARHVAELGIDHDPSREEQLFGGPVDENRGLVVRSNPITFLDPDDPPFLVIHGDRDRVVPYRQSELLQDALDSAGVPVALHTVRGGGHGEPPDSAVLEVVKAFLWRHLERPGRGAEPSLFAFVDVTVLPMTRDTVFPAHTVVVRDGAIAAGELLGPTIVTAGTIIGERREAPARTPDEGVAIVRRQAAAGADFIKVYNRVRPDVYAAIMAEADSLGLPVAGHVPVPVGVAAAIEAGQYSIEHLTGYVEVLRRDDVEPPPGWSGYHWPLADSLKMRDWAARTAGTASGTYRRWRSARRCRRRRTWPSSATRRCAT